MQASVLDAGPSVAMIFVFRTWLLEYTVGVRLPRRSRGEGGKVRYARDMTVEDWLENAMHDAERRELPALRPLLEGLARSTATLRAAGWNLDLTGELPETPPEHVR